MYRQCKTTNFHMSNLFFFFNIKNFIFENSFIFFSKFCSILFDFILFFSKKKNFKIYCSQLSVDCYCSLLLLVTIHFKSCNTISLQPSPCIAIQFSPAAKLLMSQYNGVLQYKISSPAFSCLQYNNCIAIKFSSLTNLPLLSQYNGCIVTQNQVILTPLSQYNLGSSPTDSVAPNFFFFQLLENVQKILYSSFFFLVHPKQIYEILF